MEKLQKGHNPSRMEPYKILVEKDGYIKIVGDYLEKINERLIVQLDV